MARIGEIIDSKYEVLHEIGRGGMSVVYLTMDKRLNKQWAIKEFRKDKDDESKKIALKALLDEANLMKKLDHPTLPRIVDIIDDKNNVYIVMDYIEGESLNKVLDAYGAQPQEAVIEWGRQLSDVLDYLHTRVPPVIYRDMKPANIMLKPDGSVRLIDFGIAREYKEDKEGDTTNIGTRGYAAPEQFGGKGQTDARTDIYSLGVTLYHLVTGKNPAEPPYEIYPIRHWNPTLSSGLEWLIQKCTQLNPKDRYQSCAEVTYVLENLDKFEGAYKKQLKTKLNLFISFLVLTVVFAIAGVGTLLIGNKIATETYESYMALNTISGYEMAIENFPEKADAYVKMANKLREEITVILPGEQGKDTVPGNTIYMKTITTSFDSSKMALLKGTNREGYVEVNYELGRLIWNYYSPLSSQQSERESESLKYFDSVISTCIEDGDMGGLTEQKYNLAKAYYLASYFRTQIKNMENQDDGSFTASESVKALGFTDSDSENTIENPFYAFWRSYIYLLELLSSDSDISDKVKITTLNRAVYSIDENRNRFITNTKNKNEKIDADEFVKMFDLIRVTVKTLNFTENEDDDKEELNNLIERLRKHIEAEFDIEIKEVTI